MSDVPDCAIDRAQVANHCRKSLLVWSRLSLFGRDLLLIGWKGRARDRAQSSERRAQAGGSASRRADGGQRIADRRSLGTGLRGPGTAFIAALRRAEERRVGKESRSRG